MIRILLAVLLFAVPAGAVEWSAPSLKTGSAVQATILPGDSADSTRAV